MEDMDLENRIVSTGLTETDTDIENSLRPKTLEDYIGQDKVKENLAVYIEAARTRARGTASGQYPRSVLSHVSHIKK